MATDLRDNFYNTLQDICYEEDDLILSSEWDCNFRSDFPEIERLITFTYLNIQVNI